MSIAHALVVADAIRDTIIRGASDSRNFAKTPEDVVAGQLAKKNAEEALSSTIATIQSTLEFMKATAPKPARAAKVSQRTSLKAHRAAQMAARNFTVAADPAAGPQAVVDGMKAENMQAGKQSLQDMATSIGPIVTTFDSILSAPYLNQYSATLNTVPVVGVKNNQLLYIQTKSQVTGLVDVWSTFSSLPPGAAIKQGDVVHIFPYKGDFCFSIGKTVWKKVHRSDRDPALQNAVDNWPALYSSDWTLIGDILPAANLAGVVPFSVLSADRTQIAFQLVTLAVDGTLGWSTSDQLDTTSKWQALKYKPASGGVPNPPKFTKIAYWSNSVVGIDDASNTWNITVSFQEGTYSVADQAKIEPVTEFTATDAGPVGLRADGYLWKRIISPPPDDNSGKDPVLSWQRWIKADGVVNIGVASPGVILDMNLLTRTLKSRYIDVQTTVYPVVATISAFCDTHETFLDNIAEAAKDYANAKTDEKRALAISNAKSFIVHAKVWGSIVSKSVNSGQQSVTTMTAQLHDVRLQLEAQLNLLQTKLAMLQAMLKEQESQFSKLRAAFWASIAILFLGLTASVVGIVTGNLWVLAGAGLLMVGGVVAVCLLTIQMGQLVQGMYDTKSQIEVVNGAITEMTNIVSAFTDLDTFYGTLDQFWRGLNDDAANVKTMDDATAALIGAEILDDTSSIQASQQVTSDMATACQTYLTVLHRQGVIIPDDGIQSTNTTYSALVLPTTLKAGATDAPLAGLSLGRVFKVARDALRQGDHAAYHEVMKHATFLQLSTDLQTKFAMANPAIWFDLPTLRNTSNIWIDSSQNFSKYTGVVRVSASLGDAGQTLTVNANSLDSSLDQARASVTQSLQSILSMGNTILTWSKQYPDIPTVDVDVQKVTSYKDSAIKACESAENQAASANNSLADFNHKATAYQQDLESQIADDNNQITVANAKADEDIQHLTLPSFNGLKPADAAAIRDLYNEEKGQIRGQRNSTVNSLNDQIGKLKDLQSSGALFNGHVLSWVDMVQAVSGNLGQIHNTLVGLYGQILEDASLYHTFIQQEWSTLVQNTNDVLTILDNSKAPVALWAVPRNAAIAASLKVHPVAHAVHAAVVPALSDTQRVVSAVSPSSNLGDTLASQASQATSFFTELETLLNLPFMKDIIGYWNGDKTKKQTLYDVTVSLRSDYTNMLGLQYDAVQTLQDLALLQEYRSGNVVSGQLPVKTFIQSTLSTIRAALKSSNAVNDKFKNSAKDFAAVLRVINTNIDSVQQQISDLNDKIDDAEKEERDKIISIVADAIAIAFASAALLASFGVIGPAGAALDLAIQIGAGATLVASGVTTVLDSLSLADLVKLIESLKATRDTLQESVDQLKKIQPLFTDVVSGVTSLNGTITDTQDVLVEVQSDVELGKNISFTQDDAAGVQEAWQKVLVDTQTWLDTVNKQGIVPEWAS